MPIGPVADEDDASALGAGAHRHGVDGGGLQLGEVDVAVLGGRPVELGGQRRAASQVGGHEHRVGNALARACAPVVNTATRAPSGSGSSGSAWSTNGRAPAGGSGAPSAASTRSARARRYSANGSGGPAPRMQTVRSTSTGGMHAPDPSKTIAPGSSDAASAAPARHVRLERRAGEAAAHPPAADRPDTRDHGVLEEVGRRVRPRLRDRDQLVERRVRLGHARLGRPAAPHAHDHRVRALGRAAAPPSARPPRSCRCACRWRSPRASGPRTPRARSAAGRAARPASRTRGRGSARARRGAASRRPARRARPRGPPRRRRCGASRRSASSGSVSTGMP